MDAAIQDIRAWADKYGDDVCLNRLLEIMQERMRDSVVIDLADELWEYDH